MNIKTGQLAVIEGLPSDTPFNQDAAEMLKRLLCNPGQLERLLRIADKMPDLEDQCRQVARRCDATDKMFELVVCPGNVNYSQLTLDNYSDNNQVNLTTIVPPLAANYVNAFPVIPTKTIRLTHLARPGYTPEKMAIDLNLAGGANNYLDIFLQFYLVPGGAPDARGEAIGSQMRGNQFLNKDGTQIHVPFPEYRGRAIDIGSLEYLALEITNNGAANNLDSVHIVIYYDNKAFYKACKANCGCP